MGERVRATTLLLLNNKPLSSSLKAILSSFNSTTPQYFSRNFATETAAVEDKVKALSCSPPPEEKRYKLYVSNLAWKVRGKDLREFFAANNPASVKVVFNESTRNSAGYGFISFLTREEAETAISDLNGKELSGRPITLRFSKKSLDEVASTEESTPEA